MSDVNLTPEELEHLNKIIKASETISDLVLDPLTEKYIVDGSGMLMNLMWINFWLTEIRYLSGLYQHVFGNIRKYREAKRRSVKVGKPKLKSSRLERFIMCWHASKEDLS